MSQPSSSSRNAGRAKSCIGCRQAKLACDARRRLNEPCSRCRSKSLNCRFDANFQRVPARKLAEEISNGLHALHPAEHNEVSERLGLKSTQDLDINSILPGKGNKSPLAEPTLSGIGSQGRLLLWPGVINSDTTQSFNLGRINLDHRDVVELFEHFGMYYHSYTMFLQPFTSLSDLLTRSPLLFWTIVLVASQDHAHFSVMYQEVATEHKALLSPIIQKAAQQIETIHALLLLCLWPIPQTRNSNNPAWNYIGLAVHAAMQLNCHSPLGPSNETHGWTGFGIVAGEETNTIDQARTWLGCFSIGTVIAAFYGLPPPMSSQQQMRSVDKSLPNIINSIPAWWGPLFSILRIMNSVVDTLGSIEDHALHFSITQMFDHQLNELKQTNTSSWRSELEVEWCNTKLYLYALTFTIPVLASPSHSMQIRIHRQEILHKALEAASNITIEMRKIGQLGVSDLYPSGLLHFVPKHYFTSLFTATTFLFRFLAIYATRTRAQESLATGLIIEAHKIFQSFPGQRELTRAAIHIETFIDILKYGSIDSMDELIVNNRLGASVMFDAVFQACRQRNIDSRTGKVLAVQEWKTVNETFAQRLPEAPAQKMRDDNGDISIATGHGSSGFETFQQSSTSGEQGIQRWGEWDEYMDLFQVGMHQWDAVDIERSMADSDLGGLTGLSYT